MSDKRIKILHVIECSGGVKKYIYLLLKYLDRSKFENILILSELYDDKEFKDLADHVEIIKISHNIGMDTLFSVIKIRRLIKKYLPDIVYAHSSIAGAVSRFSNIRMKNKCIYNPHGWAFNIIGNKSKVYVLLERIMALLCNKIICISDSEKRSALKNKICTERKLCVIYNGIELSEKEENSNLKKELEIDDETFVVGMVGRISKQKAPDIFVRMAAEIRKKIENSLFIIVGDVLEGKQEEKEKIEEMAKQLNIKLIITGWVDNPLKYINIFDVACLLSRWEGFGLVIPEYMLCKKPIIATNVDALPDLIINGENGLLVEMDDYIAASEAAIKLREDEKLRVKLIERAYKTVYEKFDASRVAKEHEKFFLNLLKE